MLLCCLFLVSVSVMFHLMFVKIHLVRFRLLRGHRLEKSCSLGWPYVLIGYLSVCNSYLPVLVLMMGFGF